MCVCAFLAVPVCSRCIKMKFFFPLAHPSNLHQVRVFSDWFRSYVLLLKKKKEKQEYSSFAIIVRACVIVCMRLKRKQKGKRTEVNSIQNRRKFGDPQSGNSCCFVGSRSTETSAESVGKYNSRGVVMRERRIRRMAAVVAVAAVTVLGCRGCFVSSSSARNLQSATVCVCGPLAWTSSLEWVCLRTFHIR